VRVLCNRLLGRPSSESGRYVTVTEATVGAIAAGGRSCCLQPTIVFDFKFDAPGFGNGGTGVLSVDGRQLATQRIPHTIPFLMAIDESFDIGSDTRTGVDDS
jgi:hypothetical protein